MSIVIKNKFNKKEADFTAAELGDGKDSSDARGTPCDQMPLEQKARVCFLPWPVFLWDREPYNSTAPESLIRKGWLPLGHSELMKTYPFFKIPRRKNMNLPC